MAQRKKDFALNWQNSTFYLIIQKYLNLNNLLTKITFNTNYMVSRGKE